MTHPKVLSINGTMGVSEDPLRELEAMRVAYEAVAGLPPDAIARVLTWVAEQAELAIFVGSEAREPDDAPSGESSQTEGSSSSLSRRASTWIGRLGLEPDEIEAIFHFSEDELQYLHNTLPGSSKRERAESAYLLIGAANLIFRDTDTFPDSEARELCRELDAYDGTNHAAYLRSFKSLVTGSKQAGFKLTGPGKRKAGELLKELALEGGGHA